MTRLREKIGTISLGRGKIVARGFGIVSAIFLLVVLSVLGVMMLNISSVQHTSSAMDVQGARAYQAARAGIEWGLFMQLNPPAAACFASPTSFPLPAGGATPSTLSNFTVTVTCTRTVSPAATRWQIRSTACNLPVGGAGGTCPNPANNADYVQRILQVEF